MAAKHRVLHVITRLELGGAQQNTLYCTEHHDRSKFDVHLIAGRGGMLDGEAAKIPDARVELVPYLVHPVRLLRDLAAVMRLRAYLKSQRIDLVHTHSSKAGIVGRLAAALARVPAVVHTVHGWSFNETQPWWKRRLFVLLERLCARWSDRLVVVSSINREQGLGAAIGRRPQYTVLHSGIEIERFERPPAQASEVRDELGFGADDFVVGYISNFKPQKAPLDFVEAVAAAHAREPRLRFFMAGDGELRPQAEARVRELGLEGVVKLLGWRRDVEPLFHGMDAFLLTSLFEGLPRTVLQAMAAGVPVVATSVDGTPEVVEDEVTGLLTPPGDPAAAAERVLRFVAEPELRERCVAEARRRLGRKFDIRAMVTDLEALYVALLAEKVK